MSEVPHVLVIGAAAIDTKGIAQREEVRYGLSNPGKIRISTGGVGRNIAENLTRLGIHTTLISAVGDDGSGRHILRQAEESGIDISHVLVTPASNTGAYIALFGPSGDLLLSMYDMSIMDHITPRYIYDRRRLFRQASFVVIDANVPAPTLDMIFKLAQQYGVPVCADPTSVGLASRLEPHLPALYMVTPDCEEAQVLAHMSISNELDAIEAAKKLVAQGVRIAIVTMAEQGACFATSELTGRIPAIETEIVDRTGAGDAMTATVVFGLLHDFSVDEAIRLGASAASLTLRCRETVCPELSLERLYDNLII